MLKTAFKIIIKYIAPEQPSFFGYLADIDEKANKRDIGFMKKLSYQERKHYSKEKGFQGLDSLYALCEFTDQEIEFCHKLKPEMIRIRHKVKNIVKTILE